MDSQEEGSVLDILDVAPHMGEGVCPCTDRIVQKAIFGEGACHMGMRVICKYFQASVVISGSIPNATPPRPSISSFKSFLDIVSTLCELTTPYVQGCSRSSI